MVNWNGEAGLDRSGIWGVYVIMNILALFFNLSLVISIWRLKEKRTSTEILIGGLSSGIIVGALGCGPQCLLSAIVGTFAYGNRACFAESYLHLVGMEIQFICVAAISHRTYIGVVKLQSYPARKSFLVVAFAWAFAFFTTSFMGYFSDFYLVASGTFCFYDWTSPALIGAAWPMAAISLGLMGFWYWKTYQAFQIVRSGAKDFRQEEHSASIDRDLAIRLSLLVILFLLGYIGIISQSLYEIMVGRAKAWGDIVAALMVLLYWDSIAFFYAQANQRLGLKSVVFFLPAIQPTRSTRASHSSHVSVTKRTERSVESDPIKFSGLSNFRDQDHHIESTAVELAHVPETPFSLDEVSPKTMSGIERTEGPKGEFIPFLPVDEDESIHPDDGRDESSRRIFNPFQPINSPSEVSHKFDFSPAQTPDEAPTPDYSASGSVPPTPHGSVAPPSSSFLTGIHTSSSLEDMTVTIGPFPTIAPEPDTPGTPPPLETPTE